MNNLLDMLILFLQCFRKFSHNKFNFYLGIFHKILTAAYDSGYPWLENLRKYLKGNIDFVDNFLKERLPKVKLIYPEGTYLLWLDFRELKFNDDELDKIMINNAKLWLDSGAMFGKTGKGFQRLNIALPRKKLKWALEQLESAFSNETYK